MTTRANGVAVMNMDRVQIEFIIQLVVRGCWVRKRTGEDTRKRYIGLLTPLAKENKNIPARSVPPFRREQHTHCDTIVMAGANVIERELDLMPTWSLGEEKATPTGRNTSAEVKGSI